MLHVCLLPVQESKASNRLIVPWAMTAAQRAGPGCGRGWSVTSDSLLDDPGPWAVASGHGRKIRWHHDRVFESSALSYQMEIIPGLYQLASRLSEQIRKSRVTAVGPNLGLFSVRGRGSWGRGGGREQ